MFYVLNIPILIEYELLELNMKIMPPLSLQSLSALQDEILLDRLTHLLPNMMDECNVDMWIVIGDEYNEGPLVRALLPSSFFHARKTSLFVFARKNGVHYRYIVSKPDFSIDKFYTPALLKPIGFNWEKFYTTFAPEYDIEAIRLMDEEDMWGALSRLVKEIDPTTIALDTSKNTSFSDGLSKTNYDAIHLSLGDELMKRVMSGECIATRFLETRSEKEIELMRSIVGTTRDIIKKAYSTEIITPGKTTSGEVRFFLMEEATRIGMIPWFDATVWIRREGNAHIDKDDEVIQKGDILHCDFGVVYGRLCSDVQEMAYIKKENDDVLIGELKQIHNLSMKFQYIVMEQLKVEKSGNEVLKDALYSAKESGISSPMLYSHPIGIYGHGPGPTIGSFGNQEFVSGSGERIVYNNTAYALELNVMEKVPSWNNLEIMWGQEIDIAIIDNTPQFLKGRQTELHIVG